MHSCNRQRPDAVTLNEEAVGDCPLACEPGCEHTPPEYFFLTGLRWRRLDLTFRSPSPEEYNPYDCALTSDGS